MKLVGIALGIVYYRNEPIIGYRTFEVATDNSDKLWMGELNRRGDYKHFKSNWDSYGEIKKSPAYQTFRLEFIYE